MSASERATARGGQNFTEANVAQMAMRYNPRCKAQLAAFSCGSGPRGNNELVAVIDDYGICKVVREVGSAEPDVVIPVCPRISGATVADALGMCQGAILVQRIEWPRLLWFFETDAGSALRVPGRGTRRPGR